ncbi:MAG: TIGR04282 family arsenosugar biosynthesis glycosyltransferase [Burkholderiales bacterium]
MSENIKVLVFAKAPVAGQVKTRLIPLLGAQGAAQLQEKLVRHALTTVQSAKLGTVELWCAPELEHVFFQQCAREYGVSLHTQSAGNLGQRMQYAFEQSLQTVQHAVLIGSDCPALGAVDLRHAATLLKQDDDAVFCPAEDGGYVLIALARTSPQLFQGVEWGSGQVMAQTRERLQMLNWRWQEMPMLWDVDRPEDYQRLAALADWHHS